MAFFWTLKCTFGVSGFRGSEGGPGDCKSGSFPIGSFSSLKLSIPEWKPLSFVSLFFRKHQRKPQKHQGFFSPCEPLKRQGLEFFQSLGPLGLRAESSHRILCLRIRLGNSGTEKAHKLFQRKHPPSQNGPFWAPRKEFMCLISWERAQGKDPHKHFWGHFGVKKGNSPEFSPNFPNFPSSSAKSPEISEKSGEERNSRNQPALFEIIGQQFFRTPQYCRFPARMSIAGSIAACMVIVSTASLQRPHTRCESREPCTSLWGKIFLLGEDRAGYLPEGLEMPCFSHETMGLRDRRIVKSAWLKSDSGRPTPKWPKIDSKVTPDPIFESLLSHFWVSLWRGTLGVTFESLLGHFNSFWISVELGARPLHNRRTHSWFEGKLLTFPLRAKIYLVEWPTWKARAEQHSDTVLKMSKNAVCQREDYPSEGSFPFGFPSKWPLFSWNKWFRKNELLWFGLKPFFCLKRCLGRTKVHLTCTLVSANFMVSGPVHGHLSLASPHPFVACRRSWTPSEGQAPTDARPFLKRERCKPYARLVGLGRLGPSCPIDS